MGPSHTLVRAGLRTAPRPGWRAGALDATLAVLATPSLWLLGAVGFLLRGGLVLLLLPVLALPSPVAIRLLIGDNLGSAGFAPTFYLLVAGVAVAITGVVLVGQALAAYADVAAFERLIARAPELLPGQPIPLRGADRRALVTALFTVQLFALCVLVAAALPLIAAAIEATNNELLRPTTAAALYERVLGQLRGPLLLLLAALVMIEMVAALATRRLLRAGHGLTAGGVAMSPLRALLIGLGWPARRPASTIATGLLGWLVMLVVVVPVLWAIGLAWDAVRATLLSSAPLAGPALGPTVLAIIALSATWLGGVVLAGLSSALRAGLWTAEDLR